MLKKNYQRKSILIFSFITLFVFSLVLFNTLTGCNGEEEGNTFKDSTGGVLKITSDKTDNIVGQYTKDGHLINFNFSLQNGKTSMEITTADGEQMFALEDKEKEVEFSILGKYRQIASKTALKTYKKEIKAYNSAIMSKNANVSSPTFSVSVKGDAGAADAVSAMPEYDLIPWLSRALGEFGYTGMDYPVTFMVHGMAMKIAAEKDIVLPPLENTIEVISTDNNAAIDTKGWPYCKSVGGGRCRLGNCPKKTSSNPALGMCGPQKTCWKWVCGDCCVHLGCLVHDLKCGKTKWQCTKNFWQFFIGGCNPAWV